MFFSAGVPLTSVTATGSTTARSLENRFAEVANVLDYGADPTGVADSWAAIQAAANWNSITMVVTTQTTSGNVLHFGANLTAEIYTRLTNGDVIYMFNVTDPATLTIGSGVSSISGGDVTFVVDNAADQVAGTVQVGDEIRFDFPNRGIIFFPPGEYSVSERIATDYPGALSVHFVGCGGASIITGNFNDYIIGKTSGNPARGVRIFEGLRIINTHPTGGGIALFGSTQSEVRDCDISAFIGIRTYAGGPNTITNCTLLGSEITNSIGIIASGAVHITGCDITHWYEGIRAHHGGLVAIGNRFEVNYTAIFLGKESDGTDTQSVDPIIMGGTFEANNTSVDLYKASRGIVSISAGNGSATAGPGGSANVRGIYCRGANNTVFIGCNVSGYYTTAGIDADNIGGCTFIACVSDIDGPGVDWIQPSNPYNAAYISGNAPTVCNTPIIAVAYASLPASPRAGERQMVNNCSTSTFNANADGAGALTVPVFHNGSAWKVG